MWCVVLCWWEVLVVIGSKQYTYGAIRVGMTELQTIPQCPSAAVMLSSVHANATPVFATQHQTFPLRSVDADRIKHIIFFCILYLSLCYLCVFPLSVGVAVLACM
jgi:hypothetical protein